MDKQAFMMGYLTRLDKVAAAFGGNNLGSTSSSGDLNTAYGTIPSKDSARSAADQRGANYFKPASTPSPSAFSTAPVEGMNTAVGSRPAQFRDAGKNLGDASTMPGDGGAVTNVAKTAPVSFKNTAGETVTSNIQQKAGEQWYEGQYGKVKLPSQPTKNMADVSKDTTKSFQATPMSPAVADVMPKYNKNIPPPNTNPSGSPGPWTTNPNMQRFANTSSKWSGMPGNLSVGSTVNAATSPINVGNIDRGTPSFMLFDSAKEIAKTKPNITPIEIASPDLSKKTNGWDINKEVEGML